MASARKRWLAKTAEHDRRGDQDAHGRPGEVPRARLRYRIRDAAGVPAGDDLPVLDPPPPTVLGRRLIGDIRR